MRKSQIYCKDIVKNFIYEFEKYILCFNKSFYYFILFLFGSYIWLKIALLFTDIILALYKELNF